MPRKFTEFSTRTQLLTTDHFVGFRSDESSEFRSRINDLAMVISTELEDQILDRLREQIGDGGIGFPGNPNSGLISDYYGDANPLAFTASAIVKTISFNGVTFTVDGVVTAGPVSLEAGVNYDLDITSNQRLAFRNAPLNADPNQYEEIYNNDSALGVFTKTLMWTPTTAGTYSLYVLGSQTTQLLQFIVS